MAPNPRSYSLLKQPLDRAAFLAFFLGAVVPLAALAWVIRRWVQPERLPFEGRIATVGLLVAIGLLSFAAFLVLRRTAHGALRQLDRDNRRLAHLLDASGALAASADDEEIVRLAAESACRIAESASAHVLTSSKDGELALVASWPEGTATEPLRAGLVDAGAAAAETLKPTVRGDEGAGTLTLAVPFAAADERQGALAVCHDAGHPFDPGAAKALSTLASLARVALRNTDLHEAERNFFTHATNLLVATLDRYLGDRADHSRRVARLANLLGRALDLPEARRERLHFAALLHDIGMLRVPQPHLSDLEEMRRHAELGDEMLRPIRIWEDLAPLVRHHQEWWNGLGYPDRLAGEAIPLESRIIGVAEAFDAMTSEKSYQEPIPVPDALGRLRGASGSQFDPAIVEAFLRLHADGALG